MGTGVSELIIEAGVLSNNGDIEGAIRKHHSVIEVDPDNATSWYCLGVLYFSVGSHEKSVEAFEKSNRLYPNHPPTLANLAYLLEGQDLESSSEHTTAAAIEIDDEKLTSISEPPKSSDESERIFVEARHVGDQKAPEDDLSKLIDYSGQNRFEEARELTSTGDHSRAVAIWKGLLDDSPNSSEVWRGLGDALHTAGYEDRAKKCLDRARSIETETSDKGPEINNDDFDQSDESLILAVEEVRSSKTDDSSHGDLEDAIGWYNMGINLLNDGKNDEAISSFEKAIGGSPASAIELKVKAHNGRGNALYNSGRYPESVVAYHTAIGLDPNSVSGRTLFNMGSSYAAVEMFDDAIKCFSQALERGLDKSDAELCEKQISRCRLLSREQSKRQNRVN